jgi:NAD(P)-dependent dehydrogenase (short-subunit alcohol dehydrogenase family)
MLKLVVDKAVMKIVIVGSSRGIGNHLKKYFLDNGHEVWGISRSAQQPSERFIPIMGNACVEMEYNQVPAIDALIYCAGSQMPIGAAMTIEPHEWLMGIRDNLFGAFNVVHTFFSRLHGDGRVGKIVLFSGGGATNARPNLSAYSCAKTAIVRLVETLSEEWVDVDIDINAIAPGAVCTDMTRQILDLGVSITGVKEAQDAVRLAKQDNTKALQDIAGCIDWLISDKSDGITGKLISAKWDDWKTSSGIKLIRQRENMVLRRVPDGRLKAYVPTPEEEGRMAQ